MIRQAKYAILPSNAAPAGLVSGSMIDVDLREVAACGIRELLSVGGSSLGLGTFLDDLLVSGTNELRWLGDGVGKGREMKRGFSAIFGRFFARWYLTKHHRFYYFLPTDQQNGCQFGSLRIQRTKGQDLPDWFMAGPNGCALGEAKGSHDKSVTSVSKAAPLVKATRQLSRARVRIRRTRISLKGWGVMSRWGTDQNGLSPLLYVSDPKTRGEPLPDDEVQRLLKYAHWHQSMRILNALGITYFNDRLPDDLKIDLSEIVPPEDRRFNAAAVQLNITGLRMKRFVGGIIGPDARLLPMSVSAFHTALNRLPAALRKQLYFFGIDKNRVGMTDPTDELPIREPDASEEQWASLGADGFVLAPVSVIENVKPLV